MGTEKYYQTATICGRNLNEKQIYALRVIARAEDGQPQAEISHYSDGTFYRLYNSTVSISTIKVLLKYDLLSGNAWGFHLTNVGREALNGVSKS